MWEAWAPVVVQIIFMVFIAIVFVVRLEGQVKILSDQMGRLTDSVSALSQGLGRLSERVTQIERDDARKGS